MPNMSYCRFENTYMDLYDCFEQLCENPDEVLSESEEKYKQKLISLCNDIAQDFSEDYPQED